MTKFFKGLCALVLSAFASLAFAQDVTSSTCVNRFNVSVTPSGVTENNALSLFELNRIGKPQNASRYDSLSMVGATTVRPYAYVKIQRADDSCLDVTVKADFAQMTLYIASQFEPGTCGFNHIREHELEHVRFYLEHLEKLAVTLPGKVQETVERSGKPVPELIEEVRQHVFKQLNAVAPLHAELDSPAEYRKNHTACQGEIRRILRTSTY